jgi:type II secretory pathway predicted ATPase ExeA
MIKSTFGITQEPFNRTQLALLPQQKEVIEIMQVHSQHGGFSVVVGNPGVGKSVLRKHIENLGESRDTVVVSISRTMHTYNNILKQLAESLHLEAPSREMEIELIKTACSYIEERKTLYTLIDEAHLLEMEVLRKLRLLFERFPPKHNLVLFGQPDLLYALSMKMNEDLKSRITYSKTLMPLNDEDIEKYILNELESVQLGANTFDESAIEIIKRSVQGNLRLCRNLCFGSLIDACCDNKRIVTATHVNNVLVQPHWRSQEELLQMQNTAG